VLRYDEMDDGEAIPLNYSEAFRLNPEFKALDFDIYRFHAETETFEGFALEVSVEDETLHRLTHYEFTRDRKDESPKAGIGNLSTKNRVRDRSSGSESEQATGQRFLGPNFRQESKTGFKTETGL
jgi:hypothetical protein